MMYSKTRFSDISLSFQLSWIISRSLEEKEVHFKAFFGVFENGQKNPEANVGGLFLREY